MVQQVQAAHYERGLDMHHAFTNRLLDHLPARTGRTVLKGVLNREICESDVDDSIRENCLTYPG
jgi:hypothetical protein